MRKSENEGGLGVDWKEGGKEGRGGRKESEVVAGDAVSVPSSRNEGIEQSAARSLIHALRNDSQASSVRCWPRERASPPRR